MTSRQLLALLQTTRPGFLLLTPACVSLGIATAADTGEPLSIVDAALIVLGALLAHIGVNALNEFEDFRSGLDSLTLRTPFSGGSGALPANPDIAVAALWVAITCLLATIAIGAYFIATLGPVILPIGLAGIILVIAYTPWLNRNPWLCLAAPGLGFGPLMVVGSHTVLAGSPSVQSGFVSLVPLLLVSNLLLLNQFPDLEADRRAGRRHFPIVYGLHASARLYGLLALACGLVIAAGIHWRLLPGLGAISLVSLSLTAISYIGARRYCTVTGTDVNRLVPFMGLNVIATLLTPLLLATAIYLA